MAVACTIPITATLEIHDKDRIAIKIAGDQTPNNLQTELTSRLIRYNKVLTGIYLGPGKNDRTPKLYLIRIDTNKPA